MLSVAPCDVAWATELGAAMIAAQQAAPVVSRPGRTRICPGETS
jgi:hypothetical protein